VPSNIVINGTIFAKKKGWSENFGRKNIRGFRDPVFSVNLEKAAFTAKRYNLPSSHETEFSQCVTSVRPHGSERARLWGRSYLDLSYQLFSRSRRRAFARTTDSFRHVRGILLAL